jgi:hypothetical protein
MFPADSEKRNVPRNAFRHPIELLMGQNDKQKILTAVVMNISDSGLRICLGHPLCEGQEILIKDQLPNGHQRYKVQWSNEIADNFFEAGLKSLK